MKLLFRYLDPEVLPGKMYDAFWWGWRHEEKQGEQLRQKNRNGICKLNTFLSFWFLTKNLLLQVIHDRGGKF